MPKEGITNQQLTIIIIIIMHFIPRSIYLSFTFVRQYVHEQCTLLSIRCIMFSIRYVYMYTFRLCV